jgi:hypothetical protein
MEIITPEAITPPMRQCEWCGVEFERSHRYGPSPRFCSPKCGARAWEAANSEKVRSSQHSAYLRRCAENPEKVREAGRDQMRRWRAANPEAAREKARAWREANLDKAREQDREVQRRLRRADPDKFRERNRAYYAAHAEARRAHDRARRPEQYRPTYNPLRRPFSAALDPFEGWVAVKPQAIPAPTGLTLDNLILPLSYIEEIEAAVENHQTCRNTTGVQAIIELIK